MQELWGVYSAWDSYADAVLIALFHTEQDAEEFIVQGKARYLQEWGEETTDLYWTGRVQLYDSVDEALTSGIF